MFLYDKRRMEESNKWIYFDQIISNKRLLVPDEPVAKQAFVIL